MNDELEKSLAAALRPVDPGEQFTQRVLARVATESAVERAYPRNSRSVFRWASATVAIVLTAGLYTVHQWQVHRTQQGFQQLTPCFQALLGAVHLPLVDCVESGREDNGNGG